MSSKLSESPDERTRSQMPLPPSCRAGAFYEQAGVPCPTSRALPDHFLFAMNTDFKKVADDFKVAQRESGGSRQFPELPLPEGQEASSNSKAGLPGVLDNDAEEGIANLRERYEKVERVRLLPLAPLGAT